MSEGIYSTAKRKLQEEKSVEKQQETIQRTASLEQIEQAETCLKTLLEKVENLPIGSPIPASLPEDLLKATKNAFTVYTATSRDLISQIEKSSKFSKEEVTGIKTFQMTINSKFEQLLSMLESIWHEKNKNANLENETLLRVNRILDVTERNMI